MIYDIYLANEDENYRDVALDMAIEDFDKGCWHVVTTLELESDTIDKPSFGYSESVNEPFKEVNEKEAPRWVRVMAMRMFPRIEAMLRGRIIQPIRSYNDEE